jgi:hypothetical protein
MTKKGAVAQAVVVLVGLWLMFAPSVLGHAGTTAGKSDRFAGPLIAAAAFLAIFTITRPVRWFNLLPGAWLLLAPWVLGAPTDVTVSDMVAGALVLALTPIGRLSYDRYGGGWASLRSPDTVPR